MAMSMVMCWDVARAHAHAASGSKIAKASVIGVFLQVEALPAALPAVEQPVELEAVSLSV